VRRVVSCLAWPRRAFAGMRLTPPLLTLILTLIIILIIILTLIILLTLILITTRRGRVPEGKPMPAMDWDPKAPWQG